jgi:hypothetical protein
MWNPAFSSRHPFRKLHVDGTIMKTTLMYRTIDVTREKSNIEMIGRRNTWPE